MDRHSSSLSSPLGPAMAAVASVLWRAVQLEETIVDHSFLYMRPGLDRIITVQSG
jgi:hypothetical protein